VRSLIFQAWTGSTDRRYPATRYRLTRVAA
jgi:hypothetical protein